jgi:hypothetical protein
LARELRRRLQGLLAEYEQKNGTIPAKELAAVRGMAGITLDTCALIGFERAARRTMAQLKLAEQFGYELTIPTPVIVEAWREGKRSARIAALLEACVIESLLPDLARRRRGHCRSEGGNRGRCGRHGIGRSTRRSSFDCGLR